MLVLSGVLLFANRLLICFVCENLTLFDQIYLFISVTNKIASSTTSLSLVQF